MRKYLRNIARKNMERSGVKHFNRHRGPDGKRKDSYFALNWRDWINA